MGYLNSIIEKIGNTPLIKLNSVNKELKGTVLVKVEYFNPGNSIKDRIALKMIEDAENSGLLKPGGTIIENTSGNTGMGLALVAISKGYKCIFTLADKQSKEKIDILRAMGAEVVVCPTNVAAEDPRSYYSVARKLHKEIENSFFPNQYDNASNTAAHYEATGPEIWRDTNGKITHFVAGMGTGGTISGISKYIKEQNADLITVGVDSYGSVFKKYKEMGVFDESEIYPYLTEGIGEDILPKNVDFKMVDEIIKVTDKDAAVMTRRLAEEEGLFVGWSCGAAVHGALAYAKQHLKSTDMMVVILPDHGTRYLAKVYNDDWMKDHGFLEKRKYATAKDIISARSHTHELLTFDEETKIGEAIKQMNMRGVDQCPITQGKKFVGSVSDSKILSHLITHPELKDHAISEVMDDSFQFVSLQETVEVMSSMLSKNKKALLVHDEADKVHIITQSDLLAAIAG